MGPDLGHVDTGRGRGLGTPKSSPLGKMENSPTLFCSSPSSWGFSQWTGDLPLCSLMQPLKTAVLAPPLACWLPVP